LGILLDSDVDGLPFKVFEGKAELVRIVLLFFSEFEVGKHVFELMEDIVINLFGSPLDKILRLLVISHQDQVPERFGHEQLLQH
jgi:hypothetical protein